MRRWLYLVGAAAAVGLIILGVDWLRTNVLRTLMLTTADPDALGRVISDSMEPVLLTLETDRIGDTPRQPARPTNKQSVSFKVPAAYVRAIYLKEGASGAQRIEFELWNRTFEPSAPDVIADSKKCRVGEPCRSDASSRTGQRKEAGEKLLDIQISNSAATEIRRKYNLANLDSTKLGKPCKITDDSELGMTLAEAPDGVRSGDACDFIGNPGIRTRDGKSFPPKNFVRKTASGEPQYLVRCHSFSSEPIEQDEIRCRLLMYFDIWPVTVLFTGIVPKDWDEMATRVHDFLGAHLMPAK